MNLEINKLNDEEINELAAEWYFLSLQTKTENPSLSDDSLDQLIAAGLKLKSILRRHEYSRMQPLNIFVDDRTYLDLWVDDEGKIQTGELYTEEGS